jgi:hypothetical protein
VNVWLPGAEHIKGKHSVGLPLSGGNCLATMHITASPKGSYKGTRDYLVRMGFEPTLILDPTTGERGQFLPGNRGAYALEHPAGTPATNTAGSIHVQVEWVWPDMRQDITKAPHFAEQWADLVLQGGFDTSERGDLLASEFGDVGLDDLDAAHVTTYDGRFRGR